MGTTDPRLLIQALGDLNDEGKRWSVTAWTTLREVNVVQKRAFTGVEYAQRRSRIIAFQAEHDQERVENERRSAEALASLCNAAKQNADELFQRCQQAEVDAQKTLVYWQDELEAARAWLVRARERLAQAKAELQRAEQILHQAEMELSRAHNRLAACQRDKDRRNCSSERAAVAVAQAYVAEAKELVYLAVLEVRAAEEEVRQAETRVKCCEQAVRHAEGAVTQAQTALQHAETSVNEAERSIEYMEAIGRFLQRAETHALRGRSAGEEMVERVSTAYHLVDEAERHRLRADDAIESAQRSLLSSRHELTHRIEQLRLLNRAELGRLFGIIAHRFGGGMGKSTGGMRLPTLRMTKISPELVFKKTGKGSIWQQGSVPRGRDYEILNAANIAGNFPVIDDFRNGVATSYKTIDLGGTSRQSSKQVADAINKYVDSLNGFVGRSWGGYTVSPGRIRSRVLDVGIPQGIANSEQIQGLRQVVAYARSKGVSVLIKEVP